MNKRIKKEANICLHCKKKPCTKGCPLKNNIPEFIKLIKENKLKEGYDCLSKTTILPSICGLICDKSNQCEGHCIKRFSDNLVKIGELESFLGNYALKNKWKIPSPKKTNYNVLVIGGGPAGLTCAGFLRRAGIKVTIYEKTNSLGGLLVHGIPDFRLPKNIVNATIENILNLRIKVVYNQELGKNFTIKSVLPKFDAIFLSIGGNISNTLNLPNEALEGIFGGNELLEDANRPKFKEKEIIIVGGGNVSIDVARTIIRDHPKAVTIIYRKDEEEMRVNKEEIIKAKKERINFLFQTNLVSILGDKKVEQIEVVKTKLLKDEKNNIKVQNIEDSNYYLRCDYLIRAIGSHNDQNILKDLPLKLDEKGYIKINKYGKTTNPKIFAGGDVAGVKQTVANASLSGRNASVAIIRYLKES